MLEARKLEAAGKRVEAIVLFEGVAELPEEGQRLLERYRSEGAYAAAVDRAEAAEAEGDLLGAVAAYEEALAITPSEDLQGLINVLESRRLTAEAKTALDEGNVEVAAVQLASALERNPDNAEAKRLQSQLTSITERSKLVETGDALVASQDYAAAIQQYEAALALEPSEAISVKLMTAKLNRDLGEAEEAMEAGDLAAAAEALTEAQTREPDNAEVTEALAELDVRVKYAGLLTEAAEARQRSDWSKAKRLLNEAKGLRDIDEVKELLVDTEYAQAMDLGRRYLEQNEKVAALAQFINARKERDTPEVRALIAELEGRTAPTGGGGEGAGGEGTVSP